MNPAIIAAADRLGLTLSDDFQVASRQGLKVQLPEALSDASLTTPESHHVAWALLGVRLAIDHLLPPPAPQRKTSPLGFRRTNVRRYHEAPSVYGEELPFLLPTLSVQLFESLTHAKVFSTPGPLDDTTLTLIHEVGLRQKLATINDGFDAQKWVQARKALFYDAYKLRPAHREDVTDGELRYYRSTEGMMASRVHLFPEFDYDTAQDQGYLAIPTRDLLIVAAPSSPGRSTPLREALQSAARSALQTDSFGLSDAIFALHRDAIELTEAPTFQINSTPSRFSLADFAVFASA